MASEIKSGDTINGSHTVTGYLAVVGDTNRLIVYKDDGVAYFGASTTPLDGDMDSFKMWEKCGGCLFPLEVDAWGAVERMRSRLAEKVGCKYGELKTEVRRVSYTREIKWE